MKSKKCKTLRTDNPKQKPKPTETPVKEEMISSPVPAKARVLIDSPVVKGIRRIQVKLRCSQVIGTFLKKLLKSSGYEWRQVEWLCDGTVITGDETAGSLDNQHVKFKIKN